MIQYGENLREEGWYQDCDLPMNWVEPISNETFNKQFYNDPSAV